MSRRGTGERLRAAAGPVIGLVVGAGAVWAVVVAQREQGWAALGVMLLGLTALLVLLGLHNRRAR